jgi:hypothetical protein
MSLYEGLCLCCFASDIQVRHFGGGFSPLDDAGMQASDFSGGLELHFLLTVPEEGKDGP